jgi:deoxycytidine triphosphate deaminase
VTVLSDKTIKASLGSEQPLVVDGDLGRAEHCSYEFTAGKLYFGGVGIDEKVVSPVLFDGADSKSALVKPGALVWVRSRELVKMPANRVGLWIQTNTLSRKGLLLLNMSLVEPGYEGFLTAAFVNFGRSPVVINAETKIAKLMFLELDGAAESLVQSRGVVPYDAAIEEIAVVAPSTFLRVEDFLPNLEKAELDAAKSIEKVAADAKGELEKELDRQKKDAHSSIVQAVEADFKKFLWKVLGGFGVGALAFVMAFGFLYSKFFPGVIKDWDTRADEAANRALETKSIFSDVQDLRRELDSRERSEDLDTLAKRLDAIERRLSEFTESLERAGRGPDGATEGDSMP